MRSRRGLHVGVVKLDARGLVILQRGEHVEIGHHAAAVVVDLRLEILRGQRRCLAQDQHLGNARLEIRVGSARVLICRAAQLFGR